MAFTIVTVTGTYQNSDGTPASGTVTFQAMAEMANGGLVRVPSPEVATLDVTGHISIPLTATDDAGTAPQGVTYRVVESVGGTTRTWQLAVPHTVGSLDLSSVAPAIASPLPYSYALDSQVLHMAGGENVVGVKTFTTNPVFNSGAIPESAIAGLLADLAARAADSAVVHNTGVETIAGVKTFSSNPVVPAGAFPESAIASLVADLAARSLTTHVHSGVETVINVKDAAYGAVGDGVTDDRAAIQLAIAALTSQGGTIFFPPGIYYISNAIFTSTKSNITIQGSGRKATTIKVVSAVAGIQIQNVSDVRIMDLSIDCSGQTTGGAAYGIYCPTVTRLLVQNVEVSTSWSDGIYAPTSTEVVVVNCFVHNCGDNNGAGGAGANGIHLVQVNRAVIANNIIKDCTRQNVAGVAVDNSTAGGSTDVAVLGNTITNMGSGTLSGGACIRAISSQSNAAIRTKRVAIVGNTCMTTSDSSIWVNADQCTIGDNTIEDVRHGYGVEVQDCIAGILNGNTIQNIADEGICLHTTPALLGIDRWVVDGNAINLCGWFSGANRPGIQVKDDGSGLPCRRVTVTNNVVTNCTAQGILLATMGGDSVIGDNICMDNNVGAGGWAGIELYGNAAPLHCAHVIISGNRCGDTRSGGSRTQDKGISIRNLADYVTIASNDVTNNVTTGIANVAVHANISGNLGYNPVGVLGPPAVPASTTELLNPYGVDATVYLKGGALGVLGPPAVALTEVQNTYGVDAMVHVTGGTVTVIAIGPTGAEITTGLTSGTFLVPAGSYIKLTYSVAPTWVWIGPTTTVVAIGGTGAEATTAIVAGAFRVAAGSYIKLTYSVAPTWVWIGE